MNLSAIIVKDSRFYCLIKKWYVKKDSREKRQPSQQKKTWLFKISKEVETKPSNVALTDTLFLKQTKFTQRLVVQLRLHKKHQLNVAKFLEYVFKKLS